MMDIKQILLSDASTDAKLSALAILIDKQFPKLENKVLEVEKLQGPVGDKGDKGDQGPQGERGKDGKDGKNGSNGKDGVDGKDGENGVSIDGVKIDFDGSLVVTLTDGRVINVGEIVPIDVAEKIRTVHNIQIGSGGDSQTVLDAIAALQATIATYGTMATQNANNVAITGGAINNTTIGATTPSTGVFTTLTATGQTSLGGVAGSESIRAVVAGTTGNYWQFAGSSTNMRVDYAGASTNIGSYFVAKGTGFHSFTTAGSTTAEQARVSHTASAVNYVQVTGAATGGAPTVISSQGSDAAVNLRLSAKGSSTLDAQVNSTTRWKINADGSVDSGISASGGISFKASATGSQVNYLQSAGAVVGSSPILSSQGSDTNISQVFQSKGTGAIDLAAGSRGVNISNGGTVTAITRTAAGSGYTSIPSVAITAPTTAGGVQATATVAVFVNAGTVSSGGTGYTNGDVLTIVGGTFAATAATLTVTAVTGGVITAVSVSLASTYTATPTNPVSVTGGTGSGATFNLTYGTLNTFSITNAGSGYVEQPTVTFSGGGGSGAAAYATVGSGTIIRSLGATGNQSLDFYTPASITSSIPALRIRDLSGSDSYPMIQGGSSVTSVIAQGNTNATLVVGANGSGGVRFTTAGTGLTEQLRVTHTASAVNYVQVTGAATNAAPTISAQGSDANIFLDIKSKGSRQISFYTGASTPQFTVSHTNSTANYWQATGGAAGAAPVLSVIGSDTNIDLALTPKGTGNVRFGTYTANMALTIQGYVEIKDSGGTVRRLAVIA